jgi:hypothetical protein
MTDRGDCIHAIPAGTPESSHRTLSAAGGIDDLADGAVTVQ